ncbi:ATP-binding cassette domain-containing protein [Ihuprevotella massiliensis]|jgi:ABC transporter, ATP-binding protein|uniref:ABC transporter ATP-binding protein n=1 Tax=Ihuprevotella massiliensis TaxID=1852368 RepID=UPI00094F08A3
MITIQNLHFNYGKSAYKVFEDFTLNIPNGKIIGLLGRNGTGKSTLLYLISGLLRPNQGMMLVDGYVSQDRHPEMLQDIMIVPEEIDLPAVSFKDFIRTNRVYYPNFSEEVLHQVLRDFDIPAEFNLTALSMGQKKKVFMAFALATCTKYLLMDEPTNGLDIPSKMQFRRTLASQMNENRTIIVSTHQVHDVEQLIDHVVLIEGTHLLVDNSTTELSKLLRFEQRPYGAPLDDALYVEPSLSGSAVITPTKGREETPINLELLFNAIVQYPDLLHQAEAANNGTIASF